MYTHCLIECKNIYIYILPEVGHIVHWRLGADGVRLGGRGCRGTRRGVEGEEAAWLCLGLEVKGGNWREIKAGTEEDSKKIFFLMTEIVFFKKEEKSYTK